RYNVNDLKHADNLIGTYGKAANDWRWVLNLAGNQQHTGIGQASDGRFAIAYESTDNGDILLQRFSAGAQAVGAAVKIQSTFTSGYSGLHVGKHPSVAMDQDGNCVVVYENRCGIWDSQGLTDMRLDVVASRVSWNSASPGAVLPIVLNPGGA